MKKVLLITKVLCFALVITRTINGMTSSRDSQVQMVGDAKAPHAAVQQEKYLRYQEIINPIMSEAAQASGKRMFNLKDINDVVFFATLRDTTRMVTSGGVSLDGTVRLMLLCDFLQENPRYNQRATTLREIARNYCSYPGSRKIQERLLRGLVKCFLDKLAK